MTPRRQLKRTWGPFFTGFGRLTAVQGQALAPLLAGEDAVICSPTASGKTEAAVAPLIERHVPAGTDELRILYLVPTRALVNDLERRLEDPLRALRLKLGAKTGDKPSFAARETSAVLLTTPESLDSMLCRRPELLQSLRAVVLDELHLVDGSYRGDQLRVLLGRLPEGLQRVALSATVSDPAALAARYLRHGAAVIQTGEPRPLDLHLVHTPEEAVRWLREHKRHKAIWFCNRRRDVEELAVSLAEVWPRSRLVAHHGSLSKLERESAEKAMREWPWGLCVATMTLEIGIDIGDVDAVVLHGAPPTPSAFQQRIGRACRREEAIIALGVCLEEPDEADFEVLADLAREGEVEPTDAAPDLSVAVQQTFSLLYARPAGLPRDDLARLLRPLADGPILDRIWRHLVVEGWLADAPGERLRATTRLMDRGEQGRVHSNVPAPRHLAFKDAATGRVLGQATTEISVGDVVVVAGSARRVVSVSKGDVTLAPTTEAGAAPGFRSRRSGGAFRWLLPDDLRE